MNRCKCCGQYMAAAYRGWYDKKGKFHRTECFVSNEDVDICSGCNFWNEHLEYDKNPNETEIPVVYKHQHYIADINPDHKNDPFKGFGGAKTKITFNDGRTIECDNLWCQGDIPRRLWKQMPDNAIIEWIA